MNAASKTLDIIRRCGVEVLIKSGGDNPKIEKTIAVIQSFKSKQYSNIDGKFVASGYVDNSRYLYIGPSNIRLDKYGTDTVIIDKDTKYTLKRAEKVCYCNEVIYIWAMLQKCIDDET